MDRLPIQALIHNKDFNLSNCKFDLIPQFNGKPKEALWTSTYLNSIEISDWYIWCKKGDFEIKDCLYLIEPKEDTRVLKLNNVEDLVEFPTVRAFNQITLDFERIFKRGYSGITLTKEGLINIKSLSSLRRLNSVVSSFWSWDCESTVWFNTDWIKSIKLERILR